MSNNIASNSSIVTSILKPVPHKGLLNSLDSLSFNDGVACLTQMERDASKIVFKNNFFGKESKVETLISELESHDQKTQKLDKSNIIKKLEESPSEDQSIHSNKR